MARVNSKPFVITTYAPSAVYFIHWMNNVIQIMQQLDNILLFLYQKQSFGRVLSGSKLFAQACLSDYLGKNSIVCFQCATVAIVSSTRTYG